MVKKAIIFSKNEKLSKFISNELRLLDYSVEITERTNEFFGNDLEIIIFDLTSLDPSSFYKSFFSPRASSLKIAIFNKETDEKISSEFDAVLSFPFKLEKLRALILSGDVKKDLEETTKNTKHEKCFYASADKSGVTFNNLYIPLSEHEFSLLELLCKNINTTVSRDEILNLFKTSDGNISDVYICHLRNKLESPFGIKVIYTVRGKGYMTDYFMK